MSGVARFARRGAVLVGWASAAALAASAAGCATGADRAGPSQDAAAARGEALAEQSCASCHGMGLTGESHWAGAAPFRDLRIDYNAVSYQRSMARLHMGRVSMPPADISLDDVRDIQAYVRSLRRAAQR